MVQPDAVAAIPAWGYHGGESRLYYPDYFRWASACGSCISVSTRIYRGQEGFAHAQCLFVYDRVGFFKIVEQSFAGVFSSRSSTKFEPFVPLVIGIGEHDPTADCGGRTPSCGGFCRPVRAMAEPVGRFVVVVVHDDDAVEPFEVGFVQRTGAVREFVTAPGGRASADRAGCRRVPNRCRPNRLRCCRSALGERPACGKSLSAAGGGRYCPGRQKGFWFSSEDKDSASRSAEPNLFGFAEAPLV